MRRIIKNKILSWLIAALLVIGLLPVISVPAMAATITFGGGSGTSGSPWQITTAAQLASLATEVNAANTTYNAAYYKLMNDLDLTSYANWTPIGTSSTYSFKGNFDGGGYVIRNLKISTTANSKGLFGYTMGATIRNLGVVNANVSGNMWVGILAGGINESSIISNCYTTGTITGSGICTGGVVGGSYSSSITNCYSSATVKGTDYVGGVVGYLSSAGSVTYCYATGAVSGTTSPSGTGGILGGMAPATLTVSNCVALNPSVTVTSGNVGRVVGIGGTSFSNLYAFSGMAITVGGATKSTASGTAQLDGLTYTTTGFTTNATSFWGINAGFGSTNWTLAANKLPVLKTTTGTTIGGQDPTLPTLIRNAGTVGDPYEITTATELEWLATVVNAGNTTYNAAYYKLMNDIDLSGYANWTPIGKDSTYTFKGVFDGNGYVVSNLKIDSPNNNIGLFGYMNAAGAVIKNLGVMNVNITGVSYVGGVVGYIGSTGGTVSNCYTTGTITISGGTVGGVVGCVNSNGTVESCYSIAGISSTNTGVNIYAGGVVGWLNGGAVQNCYATGAVSSAGGKIGGVVGNAAAGKVENCVALNPSVTGNGIDVKRVVGINSGTLSNLHGFSGTTVNGATVSGTTTDKNGADVTAASIKTTTFWDTTVAFPATDWTITANKLPFLKTTGGTAIGGQDGAIPSHIIATYTVTLHGNGGTGTDVTSYIGGDETPLPDWTKPGYTFDGWYNNAELSGYPVTAITAAETGDKEYWAKWAQIKKITEITDTTATGDFAVQQQSNLDTVFDRIVNASDLSGDNVVTLSLNVSDIGGQTTETEAIKQVADKGSEVYFFDVTLTKQINTDTPQKLSNIPVPLEVHIQLTGDLAGKSHYKVYRYHNGRAQAISNDITKTEYYTVDIAASEIIIYTMKFSTYAIFANDVSLHDLSSGGEDVDVQAKVIGEDVSVYKVDIHWGPMRFEWKLPGQVYNPDTHEWEESSDGAWKEGGHNGVNNRIICANHSNKSLTVSFAVMQTLDGVNYDVLMVNDDTGQVAQDVHLSKVPVVADIAPEITAYLRVSGEPTDQSLAGTWQKVGVIAVTFMPSATDLDKTPKN